MLSYKWIKSHKIKSEAYNRNWINRCWMEVWDYKLLDRDSTWNHWKEHLQYKIREKQGKRKGDLKKKLDRIIFLTQCHVEFSIRYFA